MNALPPFTLCDCALVARTAGLPNVVNLRELRERLALCSQDCLFHHCSQTMVHPSFDYPEFRNDFAVWASRDLRDRVLAERLGVVNPYRFESLEGLRAHLLDVIDERLAESDHVPWAPRGREFFLMQSQVVVFDTGLQLRNIDDLAERLPQLTNTSLYYHAVDARRRTPEHSDDFSAWLAQAGDHHAPLLAALRREDCYFVTLDELRGRLVALLHEERARLAQATGAGAGEPEVRP